MAAVSYITNLDKSETNALSFDISCSREIANALRRTLLAEVPVYALDNIIIHVNGSEEKDEKLILQMSTIHINNNVSGIENVSFSLNVRGRDEIQTVMSSDLVSSNGKEYFPQNIPITILKASKDLKLTATLNKGTSKQHAKYAPVSLVGFKEQDGHTITYKGREYKMVRMTINSVGVITPTQALKAAIDVLIQKVEKFKTDFTKVRRGQSIDTIRAEPVDADGKNYIIRVTGETETLGEIIKSEALTLFKDVICGYLRVHPLKEIVDIKIASGSRDCLETISIVTDEALSTLNQMAKDVARLH